ncbi:MAG: succinyl-diaminopimelate desuccinylase [Acidimicrobiales bacterium]|jgi:succinyl-diaminopimelate desuccinylase
MSREAADLLELTAELVDISSVSHDEDKAAAFVLGCLSGAGHLVTTRIGNNVVARTSLGRARRLLIAGHLDTVPPNGNEHAVIEGDRCSGLGSADMKGGVAVMIELARRVVEPAVDVSYVWYACEEVEQRYSGLVEIEGADPQLLVADAAVLAEPTASVVEAGCQGVLRIAVRLGGERAHTARSWMGVNAIHRLGLVLDIVDGYDARMPALDGCEYRESLQAVRVDGGIANNVVPDEVRLVLNHRYAPDRTKDEAFQAICELLSPVIDTRLGDQIELEDFALAAAPNLDHPLLAALVAASGSAPRGKLGWTDVSFFNARGVPAANFGPGNPQLAHTAGEWVGRDDLELVLSSLGRLVSAEA